MEPERSMSHSHSQEHSNNLYPEPNQREMMKSRRGGWVMNSLCGMKFRKREDLVVNKMRFHYQDDLTGRGLLDIIQDGVDVSHDRLN